MKIVNDYLVFDESQTKLYPARKSDASDFSDLLIRLIDPFGLPNDVDPECFLKPIFPPDKQVVEVAI